MKLEPRRTARYYYLRFIRLKGDPSVLARGVAVGTFIGITPTIPFHTVMALGLSFILRGSKVAALLATFLVSNPLTFFPQYYLSWQIGNWLLPGKTFLGRCFRTDQPGCHRGKIPGNSKPLLAM